MSAAIGVFDSGIGGLTVVRALRARLPEERIIYFGDTARVPYGTKSAETIIRFAVEDAEFLIRRGVKMVVVACHSASSVALPELGRRLTIPVVGVIEPGARAVVGATKTNRVGVIGTSATIGSAAYEKAIRTLRRDVEIIAKATPLFVPLAEEGWLEGSVVAQVAERYLASFRSEGVDAVLLGCTHFPLLASAIGRVLGPRVRLVDSSVETAVEAARKLEEHGLLNDGAQARPAGDTGQRWLKTIYLSDLTPSFETVGARFLGEPLGEVLRATVSTAETSPRGQ